MEEIRCEKEKIQKIKQIIEKEIEKELNNKQNEVTDICEKIKTILRNLDLLKYIVAVDYYDQNPTLTQKKGQEDENEEEKTQTQIHPCIKKLLPFHSKYDKSFGDMLISHSYETRNSKKLNFNEITSDNVRKEANSDFNQENNNVFKNNAKLPQYIPPLPNADEKLETVKSSRGNVSKELYRVIIGNVSKWIPPDTREDNSTHKWMVYIRNKDNNKDITTQLKKVRYFLHESYKPHDIIDVTSPPFHLTRRGWGEFPVRIQLHFNNPLNKPIDIIHNLKLDMTHSGVQMLGAETTIEMSLYSANSFETDKNDSKSNSVSKVNVIKSENVKEKQDVFDGSLLTSINCTSSNNYVNAIKEEIQEVVIKQEPQEISEFKTFYNSKREEMNLAILNSRKFLLDRRKMDKIIEIEHNYSKTNEKQFDEFSNKFTKSILKIDNIKTENSEKVSKNETNLDLSNQIINKKNRDLLNKLEITSSRSENEIFKHLKSMATKLETETQSKYCMKIFRNMYFVNIAKRAQASKLTSVESLIRWFVQKWPIITSLALDPTYKTIHPYSSPTEEEYSKYNIGKQRSAEWFRAKAIQKVLKSLKPVIPIKEEIWTTKQIFLWSRFHGYSPSFVVKNSSNNTSETNDTRHKRLKFYDSSSDSEEGSSDNPNKKVKTNDEIFPYDFNVTEKKKNFKKHLKKENGEKSVYRFKNYKDCNTYSGENDCNRFGSNEFRVLQTSNSDSDIEVVEIEKEVTRISGTPTKKKEASTTVQMIPPGELLFNKFVCNTAKQIGVKVTEEEIIPGVMSDSVSRVLSKCASNFLEELIRRSFAQAWLRNGDRRPDSLEVNDVLATIIENERFDIFTNRGLGTSNPEKL